MLKSKITESEIKHRSCTIEYFIASELFRLEKPS